MSLLFCKLVTIALRVKNKDSVNEFQRCCPPVGKF